MRKAGLTMIILFSYILLSASNSTEISIIPKPNKLSVLKGQFILSPDVEIIITDYELQTEAIFLKDGIKEITNFDLNISDEARDKSYLTLTLNPNIIHPEGYQIQSSEENIEIEAQTTAGIFYGIQSLLQIIPPDSKKDEIKLPLVQIEDTPRFKWRGLHLDVSRHFFPVDFIKKTIDMIAMHKMNVFHWHLTDDQGWRMEIKKYPLLTEVGAWRDQTKVGHMAETPHQFDGEKHGGFYSQEQIKEIIEYAKMQHVTIVPEIELPGHAQAAIAAYPELGCFDKQIGIRKIWGISDEVYCAGKESTFEFLENVLDEVIQLFPGDYIHIGGDECPKKHWKKCPSCQQRIKEEGLYDEYELQSYFVKRINSFLNSKGKKLIGWDEILEGGLAEGATVMSWRGEKGGIEAAELGNEVVMTPTSWCYFDYYQSNNPSEPLAIGGLISLEKIYNYEPIPSKLPEDKHHLILGTQANVWTEYISTTDHAEYMMFPRLSAISEVQWTQAKHRGFKDFENRMDTHYQRLSLKGINFRVPVPKGLAPIEIFENKVAKIELLNSVPSAKIHYTVNGEEPTIESPVYNSPLEIELENDIEFKAAIFLANGKRSNVISSILKRKKFKISDRKNLDPGLHYEFFHGPFKSYQDIKGKPAFRQKAHWLVISPQENVSQKGWIYKGYIQIDQPGKYLFELDSNCGSAFFIDDELIIDNDGFFYSKRQRGSVELQTGLYPITVKYFNNVHGQFLRLYYQKPGSTEMEVFPGTKYFRSKL